MLLRQIFFGNGAGCHTHCCFTGRSPAPATVITHAIFLCIGIVSMRRPKQVLDLAVILAFLISIFDQQANRRAGGQPLENSG